MSYYYNNHNTSSYVNNEQDYSQRFFDFSHVTPSDSFITTPYPYQLQTMAWMLHREDNVFDNIRGGLLMLDQGTGKTLCALGTMQLDAERILQDIEKSNRANEANEAAGDININTDIIPEPAQVQVLDSTHPGITLIVCPASLCDVWISEVKKHFVEGAITSFSYYGSNRKKQFEKYILQHGLPRIIVTSYQTVRNDVGDQGAPIRALTFRRMVLDECHYLKNSHSQTFAAIRSVSADIKWFLSGTPIMNSLDEIYSYLTLSNYRRMNRIPLVNRYTRNMFNKHFVGQGYFKEMQDLLRIIAIRRTKAEVLTDLPSKTINHVLIDMLPTEKLFYEKFKEYSRTRFRKLLKTLNHIRNFQPPNIDVSAIQRNRLRMVVLHNILSLLHHLRIACCDQILLIDKIPRTKGETLVSAGAILESCLHNDTDDCKVCHNDVASIRNKSCGHSACPSCWEQLSKLTPPRCATCFSEFDDGDIIPTTKVVDKDAICSAISDRISFASSKTRYCIDTAATLVEKGHKVIIVSQWTSYLRVLKDTFERDHPSFEYMCLNGSVPPAKRSKLIADFQSKSSDVKVCFASLSCAAEGITLTAASEMIFADVFWNYSKMAQMSDRIYRIGQKKPVNIHHVYLTDTIEMKIKELVEQKDLICQIIVDCKEIDTTSESFLQRLVKLLE